MHGRCAAGAIFVTSWALTLTGCGYVGPVLPPSPQLPHSVTDLVVIERGDQLVITFTTPARTTDNLPVKQFSSIDLRIGAAPTPFDFAQWADSATQYELPTPEAGDPENPLAVPTAKSVPAAEYIGKRVAVAVRTSVKKNDHFSSWSNRVILNVVPPLAPPVVTASATFKGVLLTWPSQDSTLEYRVYRNGAAVTPPAQIGTAKTPDFLDTTSQYETPYSYTVVAVRGAAESLPSKPAEIATQDKFAPSVPASVTALAAPNAVEVSWQRSPESDLKGYFLYRSVNGGPSQKIGSLLTVPAYSDHDVEHGKTYRYQVSAVDQKNNESAQSAPAEVSY